MSELSDNVQQQLYEHILREKIDDLEAREEQYEARIAELEHDLSNKEIEYTDLWDDMLEMQSSIAELEAENERFTVHSDIERQDDKSPNDTQTQTIVYRKESEE